MTPAGNPIVFNALAGDVHSDLEMTAQVWHSGVAACTVDPGGSMKSRKHIGVVALILNSGVAGIYAQQQPVKMTFSGTSENSNFNFASGAGSSEDNFAGDGTLGAFTFRDLAGELPSSTPPSTCSGPNMLYGVRVVTTGVFRFRDGSLLNVNLIQGSDCIDLAAQQAHCTIIFKITGGTGRFKNVSGMLTFAETVVPVLADASGNPVFFTSTGSFTGIVSGVAAEAEPQDGRQ
jgi:hypothetical protein